MGNRVIRGCIIPSAFIIAPMVLLVEENITALNVREHVVFGLSIRVAEDLKDEVTDSVVFGLTTKQSEDLQDNLSESVRFKNDAEFTAWQPPPV